MFGNFKIRDFPRRFIENAAVGTQISYQVVDQRKLGRNRFYPIICLGFKKLYSGLRQSYEFSGNKQMQMVFSTEEFLSSSES